MLKQDEYQIIANIKQKFGHLTVIEYIYNETEKTYYKKHKFRCVCDCGNECIKSPTTVISGKTKCCYKNCKYNEQYLTERYEPRIGLIQKYQKLADEKQRFGHLTIIEYIYDGNATVNSKRHTYRCLCDCGNYCIIAVNRFGGNKTAKSCGFKNCIYTIHGKVVQKYQQIADTKQKFNHLTVVGYHYDENEQHHQYRHKFKCVCDCGEIYIGQAYAVIHGKCKSCNHILCQFNEIGAAAFKYKSMIGQKFNKLTVLEYFYDDLIEYSQHRHQFKCICDCGEEYTGIASHISNSIVKSCRSPYCEYGVIGKTINKYDSMIGQKFNTLTIIEFICNVDEKDPYYKYQFKCSCTCGNTEYYIATVQLLNRTPTGCDKCYLPSTGEQIFGQWLYGLNSQYSKCRIPSKSNIQHQIEIDFLIDNVGIELHGLQTHATILKTHDNIYTGRKPKNYHLNKTISCEEQGIDLMQFWNTELFDKPDIVKSIVLNRLGKTPYRGYARKCTVKEITKIEYDEFIINNHIQGITIGECIRIGLYYNGVLVSVMSFGKPRGNLDCQWEMFRFSNLIYTNVIGSASKLFTYFLKIYSPESIVSYSDRRVFNNGKLYETLGFEHSHNSDPNYWYFLANRNRQYLTLFHRSTFMKHKLKDKLQTFDPNLTEWENMENNGYLRIYDCGNKVYKWYA